MSVETFLQARMVRLCRKAVSDMTLDLSGLRVLTEAATGPFAATATIAALAGAEVVAVSRDSRWGSAQQAFAATRELAERLGCDRSIIFSDKPPAELAAGCDLVTNLGFVRPIDGELIARLSSFAAVSLMWEPWEFRDTDIDRAALDAAGIPLIATNEAHPRVRTFAYLGPTIGRLLLDEGFEIVGSRLLIVGSDPFGAAVANWLADAGACVIRAELADWAAHVAFDADIDALVVVEHRDHRDLLTVADTFKALRQLAAMGAPIVRLCGTIDRTVVAANGGRLVPATDVPAGVMSVTTAYAGPRPVIDLHTAGLKAGGIVVAARRSGASIDEAISAAVASGFGLAMGVST
ncbi:MAG: hypothetical protein ACMUJJ_05310 [Roseicyclus sp.]|uniref:hypothetical protein n=1 Tax=Roseicyclus sp. TaxID=1914329 RepID=UPI003A8A1D16